MDVEIGEVSSTVRAVDGDSLVNPAAMQRIVQHALRVMQEAQEHAKRVAEERQVTGGVADQQFQQDAE
jgi:hypothetical protein